MCEDDFSIYLVLYEHDILIASKSLHKIRRLREMLGKEFEMKNLGGAKKILGAEIQRDQVKGRLWLN